MRALLLLAIACRLSAPAHDRFAWTPIAPDLKPQVDPVVREMESWTPVGPTNPPLAEPKQPPERCAIRIVRDMIIVDGDPMKRAHAVSICKARGVALVELAASSDRREWVKLRSELEAANVKILERGERGDHGDCHNNPLAKGCMPR